MAIKETNANTIWVTLSGYNSDAVYESTDGGNTWNNISAGLPEIPAYSIVQNKQSTNELHLYVGTELGIYYKQGTDNWVEYNTGLPNVKIGEIEIYYDATPADSKLRAATYGRGLWETPIEQPNTDFPNVLTDAVTNIAFTTATSGGNVTREGASSVTERGVVWNTTGSPILTDEKIIDGSGGSGVFTSSLTGLVLATTYYIRAYATNSQGTTFGNKVEFTTICNVPATQATNFASPTINDNDITLTWTSGGDHVIVLAKEASAIDVEPKSGISYTANANFTIGENIGSNNIAVYSGTNETITVTNLNESTEYYFAIYKYNDTEKCYNIATPATGNATSTGYCLSYATGNEDSKIDEVILNTININSAGACATYTNNTSVSTDLEMGETYQLSVTTGTCNENYSKAAKVFIDWNGDKDFEDTDELVYTSASNAPTTTYTTDINIPLINVGSTRMRIVCVENDLASLQSCGDYRWGETEDYTVNVICKTLNITTNPVSQNVCEGEEVTFNIEAAGSDLSYQWKKGATNVGIDSDTYTIASATIADAGDITCVVTDICNNTIISEIAVLTFNTSSVAISVQPSNVTVCEGEQVDFSITASNGTGFQWQKNGEDISGANTSTYSIAYVVAGNAGNYTCKVSGACGILTSDVAVLTIPANVAISIHPVSQFKCLGENTTITVAAAGEELLYQWQKDGVNMVDEGEVSGTNTNNLVLSNIGAINLAEYACIVSGSCGADVTSNVAILAIPAEVAITTDPLTQTKCEGEEVVFSVVATGDALAYQWKNRTTNVGSNSAVYTIPSVSVGDAGDITCIVSNTCDDEITSDIATLLVNESTVSIIEQPKNATVCEGEEVKFAIEVNGEFAFLWQKDGLDIQGATEMTYTINQTDLGDVGNYTCIVSDDCGSITSNAAELIVNESNLEITVQPANTEICQGESAEFSVTATDAISYQWQKKYTDIEGATSSNYIISSATVSDDTDYRCFVSNTCETVISNVGHLIVNATEITKQPVNKNANAGAHVLFNVEAKGTSLEYQWRFEQVDISGAEDSKLTLPNVTIVNQGNYEVVVSGDCGEITSDKVSLSVTTSINDLVDYGINIYPNPSNGVFKLDVDNANQDIEVVVMNYEGRVVYQANHNSKNSSIDLSNEAQGVYLLKLNFEGNSLVSRIIIE